MKKVKKLFPVKLACSVCRATIKGDVPKKVKAKGWDDSKPETQTRWYTCGNEKCIKRAKRKR